MWQLSPDDPAGPSRLTAPLQMREYTEIGARIARDASSLTLDWGLRIRAGLQPARARGLRLVSTNVELIARALQ